MSIFNRIIFILVAVCVPVIAIFGAVNIVFRMPDLYIYEFTSNETAREMDLGIKDNELGQFFSDFMSGKQKDFDLVAEYRDREQAVFGTGEQINMEHVRKLLNKSLAIIAGASILLSICFWILLSHKKKYELRAAFKSGVLVFASFQILLNVLFIFGWFKLFLFGLMFINSFGADDTLPLLFTEEFATMGMFANTVVSIIVLIIMASITWKLTKPRRMFQH